VSGAGDRGDLASGHHLLPHERWFASLILKRQRTHRTPAILRMEQNYGPEGIALMSAGMMTAFPGQIIGCVGIVLLLTSGDHGSVLTVAYWTMGAGVLLAALGSIRYVQGVYAGRRLRGDRPFVNRT
jgi:hypothetical protein